MFAERVRVQRIAAVNRRRRRTHRIAARTSRFPRLRALPWPRIALGSAAALALIVVVPPLRNGALALTSDAMFLAASPFSPNVSDFNALPQGTKVMAADGSLLTELDGSQHL